MGQRLPPRLERDASFVPVNASYLAHAANALLWQSKVISPAFDTQAASARVKMFAEQANAMLPRMHPAKGARLV